MDLTAPTLAVADAIADLRRTVAESPIVIPEGGRTHWGIGATPRDGAVVRAPRGEIRHDPADLTVTVAAGTTVGELTAHLAAHGQECPLDPRDPDATVGGVIAAGLSGHRRLRHGPLRDRVLEVRFVTGEGRVVKAGGPTVKNVSGYDLPRLLVGSLGTLGVIVQVTLRCIPRARRAVWGRSESADPMDLRRRLFRPSCIAWDGRSVACLLEGHPDDVDQAVHEGPLEEGGAPVWPDGPCRGRISIRPRTLPALGAALGTVEGLQWVAEVGVGTVHVAAFDGAGLEAAREHAHALGGWLLRETGADVEPFGRPLPNAAVLRRLQEAFDPQGRLNPGRLPR